MTPETSKTERVFRIGFAANAGLALVKLGVGWIVGSRALVADGWHSFSDVVTGGGAWLAHRFSNKPPDEDHHYGHGGAEALSSAGLGLVLLAGGVGVVWSSWASSARLEAGGRGLLALAVAALSIVANLALAWITRAEGLRSRSHGLLALSRDNASDGLAGSIVIAGILGSRAGLDWAESVASFTIGILILAMGWRSFSSGLDVLMDRVTDPDLRKRLEEAATRVEGVKGVQSLRIHPLGRFLRVDVEIAVDGDLTVTQGHRTADRVERAILEARSGIESVQVHVEPWIPGGSPWR